MPQPDLTVLAEGDLPTGQHWVLKAGGTTEDFYTFLETIHADGRRDSGGMGGPPLYPGSLMNTYTGGADGGLRRVVVRADPSVAQVRLKLTSGEQLMLAPLGTWPDVSVAFSPRCSPRPRAWRRLPPPPPTAARSNRRICPGTRQAGSVSCGGKTAGRTDATGSRWLNCPSDGGSNAGPIHANSRAGRSQLRLTLRDRHST